MGVIALLILVGNLHYESQIRLFEKNMADRGLTIGRVMAGLVARTWVGDSAESAMRQVEVASDIDTMTTLKWIWLDEFQQKYGKEYPGKDDVDGLNPPAQFTFDTLDENKKRLRHTYFPVTTPDKRSGGLLLTQSLAPLAQFTRKTLVDTLVVSVFLVLVSSALVYFLIFAKIRRPLEKLSRKAMEIGKGNLAADLEIKGDDELVHLAKIMNDMCTRLFIAQEKIHFENLARLKTLEQLRHTEKLSTVGQIAAGIAHEIGTPLNVVDGRAKMIIYEPLEREEILGCARIIKAQAERMTLIIRQLLDFSRKKKVTHKALENVVTLIRQVFHLLTPLAAKQGVELCLKVAPEAKVHCLVDGQQIQQVFMNVIMNGIQATPGGGSVEVDVRNIRLKSMLHTDNELMNILRIDIRDEGEGIPVENFIEIFTPFFTTKSVGLGTGLGLSIAQELLEEHGGWIEVHNRVTRGAEFALFLKLEET